MIKKIEKKSHRRPDLAHLPVAALDLGCEDAVEADGAALGGVVVHPGGRGVLAVGHVRKLSRHFIRKKQTVFCQLFPFPMFLTDLKMAGVITTLFLCVYPVPMHWLPRFYAL